MGCCTGPKGRFYVTTASGIAKVVAIVVGAAPLILAVLLFDFYAYHDRPESDHHIRIRADQRTTWELGFLIVVASAIVTTVFNLLICTCFKSVSTGVWSKRIDCGYLTLGGTAQAVAGFVMVACALTSTEIEPVEMKYAAGFLGIASGIVYWGAASLVNRD